MKDYKIVSIIGSEIVERVNCAKTQSAPGMSAREKISVRKLLR